MHTQAGSGHSFKVDTRVAAREAADQALAALQPLRGQPALCLVFASPAHDLKAALAAAAEATGTPPGQVVGSTTAGEITERGLTHGGLCVLVLCSEQMGVEVALADELKAQPGQAVAQLCARFGEVSRGFAARGLTHSTTVLLLDGMSGVGEGMVHEIMQRTRPFQQVVGGAAGDEGAFQATLVGAGGRAAQDSAVAVHCFGPQRWGVGVGHGLRQQSRQMIATRARDNLLFEIDGQPAFEVYRTHARQRDVHLQQESAGRYLINNELGIFQMGELRMARAPLAARPDGALVMAAAVPQGATVCILDGDPDSMVSAARRAAQAAQAALGESRAAAVLLFDCVCRGTILGAGFQREIDALREVFPGVPIAGFLTYGEIARSKGQIDPWHNTTAVVAAIPA